MADAWGRLTEEPGVALVTAAPGHLNALSALYGALMAESPVVLLSGHPPLGQVGQAGRLDLQGPVEGGVEVVGVLHELTVGAAGPPPPCRSAELQPA